MANLLPWPGLMEFVVALLILAFISSGFVHIPLSWPGMQVDGGHPLTTGEVTDDAKIASLCSTGRLQCAQSTVVPEQNLSNGIHRDAAIYTINDMEGGVFLESAVLMGGQMTLDANLREAAPKRAFMTASAAKLLPPLTSSNTLDLLKHFGVSPGTEMATSVATSAYLCGYGSLRGEKMCCAADADAVAKFVSSELGSRVHVLTTSGTLEAALADKAPVTVVDVAKGTVAEGKSIVLCHVLNFPSALYQCHRVTGTRVIAATLKPAHGNSSNPIKAVGLCHTDTSLWLTTHPAFHARHIPRGDKACQWLVESDMLFYPTARGAEKLA